MPLCMRQNGDVAGEAHRHKILELNAIEIHQLRLADFDGALPVRQFDKKSIQDPMTETGFLTTVTTEEKHTLKRM